MTPGLLPSCPNPTNTSTSDTLYHGARQYQPVLNFAIGNQEFFFAISAFAFGAAGLSLLVSYNSLVILNQRIQDNLVRNWRFAVAFLVVALSFSLDAWRYYYLDNGFPRKGHFALVGWATAALRGSALTALAVALRVHLPAVLEKEGTGFIAANFTSALESDGVIFGGWLLELLTNTVWMAAATSARTESDVIEIIFYIVRFIRCTFIFCALLQYKQFLWPDEGFSEERDSLLQGFADNDVESPTSPTGTIRVRSPTRSISTDSVADVFFDAQEESRSSLSSNRLGAPSDGSEDPEDTCVNAEIVRDRRLFAIGLGLAIFFTFMELPVYLKFLSLAQLENERLCIVPPWKWVSATGIWHGWASVLDVMVMLGSGGAVVMYVYLRRVYERTKVDWVRVLVERVRHTFFRPGQPVLSVE